MKTLIVIMAILSGVAFGAEPQPSRLRYEIIVSHDDLAGAVECYKRGHQFFRRLDRDHIMCLRDERALMLFVGPFIDIREYVKHSVQAMRHRARMR